METKLVANVEQIVIESAKEAELATEYGDGTQFQVGQTVYHNYKSGYYGKTVESIGALYKTYSAKWRAQIAREGAR